MLVEKPTFMDSIVSDSRFNRTQVEPDISWQRPTSAQKWWISILLSFIFIIMCSSLAFGVSDGITERFGSRTYTCNGPTFAGMLIHLVIIILVIRFILW